MRRIFLSGLFVALMVVAVVFAYLYYHKNANPNELTLFGNVDVRQVDIGFRVAGRVSELFFEEGDLVPKGALMATLDQAPYDEQARQAEATFESTKLALENAERIYKRRQELIGIGGVSQEDLDNSQTSRDQLLANLKQSEAGVQVSLDNLAFTKAYAPEEGIILTRIREPGTVVNPSDPVYTLSLTSPVWIRAYVDEPHLGQVYYGMPAEVHTDIKDGPVYQGYVGFISPVSEFTPKTVETAQLRTDLVYRLRIYVDNPDRYLLQGMPVTVKLALKRPMHNSVSLKKTCHIDEISYSSEPAYVGRSIEGE